MFRKLVRKGSNVKVSFFSLQNSKQRKSRERPQSNEVQLNSIDYGISGKMFVSNKLGKGANSPRIEHNIPLAQDKFKLSNFKKASTHMVNKGVNVMHKLR